MRFIVIVFGVFWVFLVSHGSAFAKEIVGESILSTLKEKGVIVNESNVRTDPIAAHAVQWFYLGGGMTIFEYRTKELRMEETSMRKQHNIAWRRLCRLRSKELTQHFFAKDRIHLIYDAMDQKTLRVLRGVLGTEYYCDQPDTTTVGE